MLFFRDVSNLHSPTAKGTKCMPAISEDQLLPLPLQANTHKNLYVLQKCKLYVYVQAKKDMIYNDMIYIYIVNINKTPYITFNSKNVSSV